MQVVANAHNLVAMRKQVYVNHCNYIYVMGSHFYEVNHPKAVQATKDFYVRNKLAEPDSEGILDIEVSLDVV